MAIARSWLVGVQQRVRLPHREFDDTIERTFTVRATTAKQAEKAVRDTGIRGEIQPAIPEKHPYMLAETLAEARERPTGSERRRKPKPTKPVLLDWDNLHIQSREEILQGAGMQTKLAGKRWADLDPWIQETLRDSLGKRSGGKAKVESSRRPLRGMTKAELKLTPDAEHFLAFTIRSHFSESQKADAVRIAEGVARVDSDTAIRVCHLAEAFQYIDAEGSLADYIKSDRQPAMNKSRAKAVMVAMSGYGATDLQAIHDARSPRSKSADESRSNALTVDPDDPRVERWIRDQGRMDIRGIDTPRGAKSKKPKKPVRKANRGGRILTQVKGLRKQKVERGGFCLIDSRKRWPSGTRWYLPLGISCLTS